MSGNVPARFGRHTVVGRDRLVDTVRPLVLTERDGSTRSSTCGPATPVVTAVAGAVVGATDDGVVVVGAAPSADETGGSAAPEPPQAVITIANAMRPMVARLMRMERASDFRNPHRRTCRRRNPGNGRSWCASAHRTPPPASRTSPCGSGVCRTPAWPTESPGERHEWHRCRR